LKFNPPDNPRPFPPERVYILRVDLFDGFEMPEEKTLDVTARVFVTCGPYKAHSPKGKVINCTSIWNYSFPDIKVTAPEDLDQVFDVVVYLSKTVHLKDAVSYLRIPVRDVLSSRPDSHEIKKFTLIEDIAKDELKDEEFPGIMNMRITFYDEDPPPRESNMLPPTNELAQLYEEYVLRVFVYMGRDLPPADDTGLADPFVIIRCAGEEGITSIKQETLNPGWFETIELNVKIPVLGNTTLPIP